MSGLHDTVDIPYVQILHETEQAYLFELVDRNDEVADE